MKIKNLLSIKFDREVLVQLLGVDRVDIDEIQKRIEKNDTIRNWKSAVRESVAADPKLHRASRAHPSLAYGSKL